MNLNGLGAKDNVMYMDCEPGKREFETTVPPGKKKFIASVGPRKKNSNGPWRQTGRDSAGLQWPGQKEFKCAGWPRKTEFS